MVRVAGANGSIPASSRRACRAWVLVALENGNRCDVGNSRNRDHHVVGVCTYFAQFDRRKYEPFKILIRTASVHPVVS